jgi:hypothetical protein
VHTPLKPCFPSHFTLASLTVLTSRRNGLVTVYDVSRGDGGPVQSRSLPYALPLIAEGPNRGHLLFRHPQDTNDSTVALYTMDARGSIHGMELGLSEGEEGTLPPSRYDFEWMEDVQLLEEESIRMKIDYGPMAARAEDLVNFEPAYRGSPSDRILLEMPSLIPTLQNCSPSMAGVRKQTMLSMMCSIECPCSGKSVIFP